MNTKPCESAIYRYDKFTSDQVKHLQRLIGEAINDTVVIVQVESRPNDLYMARILYQGSVNRVEAGRVRFSCTSPDDRTVADFEIVALWGRNYMRGPT